MPSQNINQEKEDTALPNIHDLFHQMNKGDLDGFAQWFASLSKPLQETVRNMKDGRSTGLLEQAVVLSKHDWLRWCLQNDWPIVHSVSGGILFECNISSRFTGGKKPVLFRDLIAETSQAQWRILCEGFNRLQLFQQYNCINPLTDFLNVLNKFPEHKKIFQDVCGTSMAHLFLSNGFLVGLEALSDNGFDNDNIVKALGYERFKNICISFLNFLNLNANKTRNTPLLKSSYEGPVFNHIMQCDEMKRILTTMWTDETQDNPLFKWTQLDAVPLNLAVEILDKMLSVAPVPTRASDRAVFEKLLHWGETNCSPNERNQQDKIQVLKDILTHHNLTNTVTNIVCDKPEKKVRARKI